MKKMKKNPCQWSIGVDIIDLDRARKLYEIYRPRLKRFLTRSELTYIGSKKEKVVAFSELLSMKEAVFKALEVPWFGLEGWRKISLRCHPKRGMDVLFRGDLRSFNSKQHRMWLNLISTKDFVLARAIINRDEGLGLRDEGKNGKDLFIRIVIARA